VAGGERRLGHVALERRGQPLRVPLGHDETVKFVPDEFAHAAAGENDRGYPFLLRLRDDQSVWLVGQGRRDMNVAAPQEISHILDETQEVHPRPDAGIRTDLVTQRPRPGIPFPARDAPCNEETGIAMTQGDLAKYTAGEAKSGYVYATPQTRAMEDDDFQNPGSLWIDKGKALWNAADGAAVPHSGQ